jgi:transposase
LQDQTAFRMICPPEVSNHGALARVKELTDKDPKRKEHVRHMLTLDGVGKVVAPSLVNALERLPLKSADAFVAFTGLDPRPNESGRYRGKRRLSKRGPSELRRLL